MKVFWAFFWTFILAQMLTYVVSSMVGETFNFATGTILGVAMTIIILAMSAIIPNEPNGKEAIH